MPKSNPPNFEDYLKGHAFHSGIVSLKKEEYFDSMREFSEQFKNTCSAKDFFILCITKILNKRKTLEIKRKNQKYIKESIPCYETLEKWYTSFSEKELKRLFFRYYVNGYETFCLAITPENKGNLPFYKFLLPKYSLEYPENKFSQEQLIIGVNNYFEKWIDAIRGDYGNQCMSKKEFLEYVNQIREFAEILENGTKLEQSELVKLNKIVQELPQDTNITADILHSFLDSLIKDLKQKRIITQCQVCKNFLFFKLKKRYCSLIGEGRNCGKKIRNFRHYKRHRKKILSRAKQYSAEYRTL